MQGKFSLEVIVYNGKKYKLVNRVAKAGDLVIYAFEGHNTKTFDGVVSIVEESGASSVDITPYYNNDDEEVIGICHGSYRVLKPMELDTPEDLPEPKSNTEIIANLARRVYELENRLNSTEIDLQTFAETAETADYKAGQALTSSAAVGELSDKVEMITDDIIMLDERSQPLVDDSKDDLATELADIVIRKIRGAIE